MKLPDELLDNFKYAITDEDIPMLEEAFNAGIESVINSGVIEESLKKELDWLTDRLIADGAEAVYEGIMRYRGEK